MLSYARRLSKAANRAALQAWWSDPTNLPSRYGELDLHLPFDHHPPELALPRPILWRLLQERTGHGDFVAWHVRFGHTGHSVTKCRCRCGAERAPGHISVCPRIPGNPRPMMDLIGPEYHFKFKSFVGKHDPYTYEDGRPWV